VNSVERVPVSVLIHARNEERQIRECLMTVTNWAQEVIVCDMESSDKTVEVAQSLGASILPVDYVDEFDSARNLSASHASQEWVLYLDADERLTPEIKDTIERLIHTTPDDVSALSLPFRTISFGSWIQYAGGWWPSYKSPPLLRRGTFSFSGRVHEPAQVQGKVLKVLPSSPQDAIEHFSHRDLTHYFDKLNHYTTLESKKEVQTEQSWQDVATSFGTTLSWYYDQTAGYKDEKAGFFLALGSAVYEAVARLKHMERSDTVSIPPSASDFLAMAWQASVQLDQAQPNYSLPALPPGFEVTRNKGRSSVYSAREGYLFDLDWPSEHIPDIEIRSVTHANALNIFGGGEVQLVESIRSLSDLGIRSNIGVGCIPPGEGLIHVYSLHVQEITETLLRSKTPYVLSPIYWDRGELNWVAPRLCGAVEASDSLGEAIAVYDSLRAEAAQRRADGHFITELPNEVKALIEGASAVLPNAQIEADVLRASSKINPKSIRVIPNAAPLQSRPETIPSLPDRPFVACVGRLEPNKNQLTLVLACRRAGLPLVLVGPEPHQAYAELCRRFAGHDTTFLGPQNPAVVKGVLRKATIHCLPSFGETPGIANLEACQAGCALVCSDRGAEFEYFGDRAVYCDPLNVVQLATQLLSGMERVRDTSFRVPRWMDVAEQLSLLYKDIMEMNQ
jgi:glycosyltransferase involved in cell wall biosynthesis